MLSTKCQEQHLAYNFSMDKERKLKRLSGNLTKISEIIPSVKENLGLEKSLKIQALSELWPLITSFEVAKNSTPEYFDKEDNLVISVNSPTLTTELSMQKISILSKLKKATKDTDIKFKDVRFINKQLS